MSKLIKHRLLRAETLTAIGIALIAVGLLFPTTKLAPLSALLPAAMLISLLVCSVILMVVDQRKGSAGETPQQVVEAPRRVLGAFLLILIYALSVDFIGFYISTTLTVPLVAYAFGYRRPLGLAIATFIVVASIYLIFSFAMSQQFPTGRLWSN